MARSEPGSTAMFTDHDLLISILAVQMNFVSRDELIRSRNAWQNDRSRHLEDLLPLTPERRQILDSIIREHLELCAPGAETPVAAEVSTVDEVEFISESATDLTPDPAQASAVPQTGPSRAVLALAATSSSRYRILRPHAQGGLGEVFLAEDTELHRQVALKQIQTRHLTNRNSRGRFMLEAQVTGGLEHPNIVPVYGLGIYADGRPYYAMRFIRGESFKQTIADFHSATYATDSARNLVFRNLLRRFVDVCNAIGYAHSRGILHRDIKPGNIMLGKYGETLVVDWGLAKRLSSRSGVGPGESDEPQWSLTTPTHDETQIGSAVGTPAFMSPEQASGQLDRLGPASDVYSLGATLYVVLTSQAPYDGDVVDVLEQVQSGQFRSPCDVVPRTPPALNAIVLKAMAFHPADRYASATELAEEIERVLGDEPVLVYREPFRQRIKRWARKHPGTVAATAASLLVSILGLAAGLYFVSAEKDRTAIQKAHAEKARDQARQRYRLAVDAFDDMVHGIQNKIAVRTGTHDLRKDLLMNARKGLQKLVDDAETQGHPDSTIVWSYFRMGDVDIILANTAAAEAEYQAGHDLAKRLVELYPDQTEAQRDLAVSYNRLGNLFLKNNRTTDAFEAYEHALAVLDRLARVDPANTQVQRHQSISYVRLGDSLIRLNKIGDAQNAYRKSLLIAQQLHDADPGNLEDQRNVGTSHDRMGEVHLLLGQTGDARGAFQKSHNHFRRPADADPNNTEDRRNLAGSCDQLANIDLLQNQTGSAYNAIQESLTIRQRLAESDPDNADSQRILAFSYNKKGTIQVRMSRTLDALESFRKAHAIFLRLADADPANSEDQNSLATSHQSLGDLFLRLDQTDEAIQAFQYSLAIFSRLADSDTGNAGYRRGIAISHEKLGDTLLRLEQLDDALSEYRKSHDVFLRLNESKLLNTKNRRGLSVSYNKLGDVLLRLNRAPEALEMFQKSRAIRQVLADSDSGSAAAQRDLCVSLERLGGVFLQLGKNDDALEAYRKLHEIIQRLADGDPNDPSAQRDLAVSYTKMGDVFLRLNQNDDALEACRKSGTIRQRLANMDQGNPQAQRDNAIGFEKIGDVLFKMERNIEARDAYHESSIIRQRLVESTPESVGAGHDLSVSRDKLGKVFLRLNDHDSARTAFLQSLEFRRRFADANPKHLEAQRNLVISYSRLGDVAKAEKKFEESITWNERALAIAEKFKLQTEITSLKNEIAACRAALAMSK